MKLRKVLSLCMGAALLASCTACGSKQAAAPAENTKAAETSAAKESESKETTAAAGSAEETAAAEKQENAEIPTLNVGWGKSLHTGNMELPFLAPELFENNSVFLRPLSDTQLELVKDGEVMAYLNVMITKGASENATLMSQGHMDIAYCSSTAMMTCYDSGTDVSILCPIQSGGVAIVAKADAPYNTFDELVEYAKSAEQPIMAGYHSAVSSPRIVLEYSLSEAGVNVTEDTADYDADVLMMDLKGTSNLIPSLASGQVELWAGPIPNPQNAEAQGIGKIIATLDELPGGKWVDFPCCTLNVVNSVKEEHPEVLRALMQATKDIMDFAQQNREKTAEIMSDYIGLDVKILNQNDTTYSIVPNEHFISGMELYFNAMTEMGKFSGRLADTTFEEVQEKVFDFSFAESVE